MVKFECLKLGGPFVPKIHGMTKFGVWVASLADIVLMKARAYQGRGEKNDMKFALGLMMQKGETFQEYNFKASEMTIIDDVAETSDMEMKNLLAQVTRDM